MNKLNILNWLSRVWHRLLVFIGIRKPGLYEMLNFFSKEGDLGIKQGLGDRLKSILENDEKRKAFLIRIVVKDSEQNYHETEDQLHSVHNAVLSLVRNCIKDQGVEDANYNDYTGLIRGEEVKGNQVIITEENVTRAMQNYLSGMGMIDNYIEGNKLHECSRGQEDYLVTIANRVEDVLGVSASSINPSEGSHMAPPMKGEASEVYVLLNTLTKPENFESPNSGLYHTGVKVELGNRIREVLQNDTSRVRFLQGINECKNMGSVYKHVGICIQSAFESYLKENPSKDIKQMTEEDVVGFMRQEWFLRLLLQLQQDGNFTGFTRHNIGLLQAYSFLVQFAKEGQEHTPSP